MSLFFVVIASSVVSVFALGIWVHDQLADLHNYLTRVLTELHVLNIKAHLNSDELTNQRAAQLGEALKEIQRRLEDLENAAQKGSERIAKIVIDSAEMASHRSEDHNALMLDEFRNVHTVIGKYGWGSENNLVAAIGQVQFVLKGVSGKLYEITRQLEKPDSQPAL